MKEDPVCLSPDTWCCLCDLRDQCHIEDSKHIDTFSRFNTL